MTGVKLTLGKRGNRFGFKRKNGPNGWEATKRRGALAAAMLNWP